MRTLYVLFAVVGFCSVGAKRSSEIPDDLNPFHGEVSKNYGNSWIAGPNDKQYQFHIGVQSWITAREYCLTQESDLLTITSPEELKWVLSHYSPEIKSNKERLIQIGAVLDDSHGMREWKWISGEELDTTMTPWKLGEPFDHLNGRERCATLSAQSQKLDDVDCDAVGSPTNMYRFVCERTNIIHEMHEINNNPLWRKVEDVLQYFGFGQTMNSMMKTLVSDEEDYWEEAKKEDKNGEEKKKKKESKTESEPTTEAPIVEDQEKEETDKALSETVVEVVDVQTTETGEPATATTPEIVEVTETPSATLTVEENVTTNDAGLGNETENAQHDENPVQHKTASDDEITANLLSLSEKKKSEELVAVDDPQSGPVIEVFETATPDPEADIVRTTKAESSSGKSGTIDDKIQNIETMIHTVETIIENKPEKNVNMSEMMEKVKDIEAATPALLDEATQAKKDEHFAGHCDEDEKKPATTDEKIDNFLSTLRTFLARNKLKDLNKIANAKNTNKTLIERLKEAVQNKKGQKKAQKMDEVKQHSHSNEIEKELQTVLTDSITENITNSSIEGLKTTATPVITVINEMHKKGDHWEVQSNEPFAEETQSYDLNKNTANEIHPKISISKEVQVDDPRPQNENSLFPAIPQIDPNSAPVESEESKKQRKELQKKTDAAYKQFNERLDTNKLIERIKQNESARKRISADRVETLAAPAPSVHHNVNAFYDMEKLFSDIGKNFKHFLATRI